MIPSGEKVYRIWNFLFKVLMVNFRDWLAQNELEYRYKQHEF